MDLIIKNLDKETENVIRYIAEKSGATIVSEKKSKEFLSTPTFLSKGLNEEFIRFKKELDKKFKK